MKNFILFIGVMCVLAVALGCHEHNRRHDYAFLKSKPYDCKDHGGAHRKPTGHDNDCDTDWDLKGEDLNSATNGHDKIGFAQTDKDPSDPQRKPRHDSLKFSHSGGYEIVICVRPNPGGNEPAAGAPPQDQTCTFPPNSPPPQPETGCNPYPFGDPQSGDPTLAQWAHVHQVSFATQSVKECNYKLTFWMRKDSQDTNPTFIDPHIVIGTGGKKSG